MNDRTNSNLRSEKDRTKVVNEIQKMIAQLSQTHSTNTTSEQMIVAAQAIKQIESNPTLKQRVINATKEGELAALEKAVDNPIGAAIVFVIKGWLQLEAD